jgi:type I restriction enzyme, S subunit
VSVLAYPAYKDSGVDWLGKIPRGWQVQRGKWLLRSIEQGWSPQCDGFPVASADEWGVLKVGCVNGGRFDPAENKSLPADLSPIPSLGIAAGDVLVSRANTRELVGSAAYVSDDHPTLMLCDKLFRLRFDEGLCLPKLFAIYLGSDAARGRIELEASGASQSMVNIGQGTILNLPMPVPPRSEQPGIVAFLERETGKIDALVAEQERLMALLKEKRHVVISQAVTKGLDPDARTKVSGVEWLGNVPATWDVKRLKFLCDVQTGSRDTENAVEDGAYPFFVRSQTVERIDSMAFDCEAILTAGDGAGVGKVFHYHQGPFDFHQRVYMMSNFKGVSGPYLFHFLRENFYKVALEGGAKSTVDSLRRPVFMNFAVCVPPLEEQESITAWLEHESAKLDTLTAEAQHAIDILRERRGALISAAVTGKIDVRGWAGAGAQAA